MHPSPGYAAGQQETSKVGIGPSTTQMMKVKVFLLSFWILAPIIGKCASLVEQAVPWRAVGSVVLVEG